MTEIHFREPKISDIEELSSLMDQLGYPIDQSKMQQNLLKYCHSHQKAWVAVMEEKVVGCVAVSVTDNFHKDDTFLRIITMVVSKDHRRSGIGKMLMKIAEDYAQQMKCSYIELTSGVHRRPMGSHDFYQSLGYVDWGESKKYFGKKL